MDEISHTARLTFWPRRADRLRAIEAEILHEKAEALGRAGQRLEAALDAMEQVREAIDRIEFRLWQCSDPFETASLRETHSNLTARYGLLRDRAHQAYQFLIVHREAVGARNHLDVERCYNISERLR
jgi:hypothetical protein